MLVSPPESKLQSFLKLEKKGVTVERGIQGQKCKHEFPLASFPDSSFPPFLATLSSSSLSLTVSSSPTAVALCPRGQRAAVGTASGMVYLLDLKTWQV